MEQRLTKVSEGPSDSVWDLHRSTIKRLYLDEDRTLPQVMEIMKRDYDFKASSKMYKRRLGLWKLDGKNLKRSDVRQIAHRKVERDAVGKSSKFFIKGREVDMDNVQRYLKKQGISSLEELDQAASPVTYNYDIVCTTPGHSPMSSGNDIPGVESLDGPHDHDSNSLHCNQSYSIPLSTNGRRSLSARRTSTLLDFLSLSPETRSRRLLSLSPIPRTPALPEALSIPEQMLSNLSLYLKGNFELDVWETGPNGYLCIRKAPFSVDSLGGSDNCVNAIALYKERKYVQFRQMLSQVCRDMELAIRFNSPNAMEDLLSSSTLLYRANLPEVANTIMSYAYGIAAMYLGASHPLAQMCGVLQKLGAIPRELRSRLWQCQLDLLEKELGPWHLSTSTTRIDLWREIDASEAAGQTWALLSAYNLTGSIYDVTWVGIMINLAGILIRNGEYENAKQLCGEILHAIDAATNFSGISNMKADIFLRLSHIAEYASNDIVEAEGYIQLGVAEAVATWGSHNSVTIRFRLRRARLLRMLGRFDEAGEIDTQIEDILGSPEIEELLN